MSFIAPFFVAVRIDAVFAPVVAVGHQSETAVIAQGACLSDELLTAAHGVRYPKDPMVVFQSGNGHSAGRIRAVDRPSRITRHLGNSPQVGILFGILREHVQSALT